VPTVCYHLKVASQYRAHLRENQIHYEEFSSEINVGSLIVGQEQNHDLIVRDW